MQIQDTTIMESKQKIFRKENKSQISKEQLHKLRLKNENGKFISIDEKENRIINIYEKTLLSLFLSTHSIPMLPTG